MEGFNYGAPQQYSGAYGGNPYANSNVPGNWNQNPQGWNGAPSVGQASEGPFHLGGQGPYVIRTKLTGRCLDVSQTHDWGNSIGDLIVYDYVGGKNQQFQLEPDGQDLIIRCVKTGKVLDSTAEGIQSQVQDYSTSVIKPPRVRENNFNGTAGQRWRMQETSAGSNEFVIYCANGRVLDVSGEDGSNNIPVIPYEFHGRNNQIWYVTPVSSTPHAAT